jgi:hypothetical protein
VIAGIVGAEAKKFTLYGQAQARTLIRKIVSDPQVTEVCSGECHLGGVDIWAREITEQLDKKFTPFAPLARGWEWYRRRNLQIARHSDVVHSIVVPYLPVGFTGDRFLYCYHCKQEVNNHVKSGACWTMREAIRMGKRGVLHVVKQEAKG